MNKQVWFVVFRNDKQMRIDKFGMFENMKGNQSRHTFYLRIKYVMKRNNFFHILI